MTGNIGPEGAGKSTIRDQLMLLNGSSFSHYEREHWCEIIRLDIFHAFRELIWRAYEDRSGSHDNELSDSALAILDAGEHFENDPWGFSYHYIAPLMAMLIAEEAFQRRLSQGFKYVAHENFT